MKADLLTQHDQQLKVVQVARRVTLVPRATYVNDEATIIRKDAMKLSAKRFEPIDILIGFNVTVVPSSGLTQMAGWSLSDSQNHRRKC